jgi:hypothetical protein
MISSEVVGMAAPLAGFEASKFSLPTIGLGPIAAMWAIAQRFWPRLIYHLTVRRAESRPPALLTDGTWHGTLAAVRDLDLEAFP